MNSAKKVLDQLRSQREREVRLLLYFEQEINTARKEIDAHKYAHAEDRLASTERLLKNWRVGLVDVGL